MWSRLSFIGGLLAVTSTAAAQDAPTGTDMTPDTVRSIVIQRADIFDAEEMKHWYARVGNSLHIMTRENVVRRELLFSVGEPFDSALVAETERNLRATGIFRRVTIDSVRSDSGLVVRVRTRDAWSTKLDLRINTGGGDVAFVVSLDEDNLLGSGARAAIQYRQDPDRSAVTLRYRRRRLFSSGVDISLAYDGRSDGTLFGGSLGQPFRTLASRYAFAVGGAVGDFRVLRFRGGDPVPAAILLRLLRLGRVDNTWAVSVRPEHQVRLGFTGQVERNDFVPDTMPTPPFGRTVIGTIGGLASTIWPRHMVAREIEGFGREEDVNITSVISLTTYAAPAAWGYPRSGVGVGLSLRTGIPMGGGFLRLGADGNGLFSQGPTTVDSGTVLLGSTMRVKPGRHHVVVLHAEAGWQQNPVPGTEFDLGLGIGMRAFPLHAFTGDRTFYTSAEYRYNLTSELFGVFGFGVAAFADYGGAWFHGDPKRTGWDAGMGLRLGINRASTTAPIRIDLAYRGANDVDPAGWVISLGQGLPFALLPGIRD